MKEQLIMKFNLKMLEQLSMVEIICRTGYLKTGNKFNINFNGSKGYLSNVEIICEGYQKHENNIIWVEQLRTQEGTLKSKLVYLYHSEEDGVRVEF